MQMRSLVVMNRHQSPQLPSARSTLAPLSPLFFGFIHLVVNLQCSHKPIFKPQQAPVLREKTPDELPVQHQTADS